MMIMVIYLEKFEKLNFNTSVNYNPKSFKGAKLKKKLPTYGYTGLGLVFDVFGGSNRYSF